MKKTLPLLLLFTSLLTQAQLNMNWQELGPGNMGGYGSCLLIDKRDPSRQTLYAGSVSGGIWKTTDGAANWHLVGCMDNLSVSCLAQGPDGSIWVGTGFNNNLYSVNSFVADHKGNGVYKLNQNDSIFHLTSTVAITINDTWAGVNGIAVNPTNPQQVLAATIRGLYKSTDGGNSWNQVFVTGINPSSEATDAKWASDGNLIFATLSERYLVRSLDGGNSWSRITNANNPGFPATQGNIQIALAPSDINTVYVSIVTLTGGTYGVYKSADKGNTWTLILSESSNFDPATSNNEGWYSNVIAVNPSNASEIFAGGPYLYTYSPDSGLHQITQLYTPLLTPTEKLYALSFVINDLNPNEAYLAGDRGIFKSTDAQSNFTSPVFRNKHRGFAARDMHAIGANLNGEVIGASSGGKGLFKKEATTNDFSKVWDEYSYYCAYSILNPDYLFAHTYFGGLYRSVDGGNSFFSPYDLNIDPLNTDQPSRCTPVSNSSAPFAAPFLLHETKWGYNTIDSVAFTANRGYLAGDTLMASSRVANTTFPYVSPVDISSGDTLRVPDAVSSRLFVISYCGVWIKRHAVNNVTSPDFYLIADSTATRATALAATKDGNTLYIGTNTGSVERCTGLNYLSYPAGQWNISDSLEFTTTNRVRPNASSINGLCVDPNNDSILLCTLPAYDTTKYCVYKSIDAGQTWLPVPFGSKGNPAYTCLIDAQNSNNYLVGTEDGVWTSTDAGQTWNHESDDMCNVPVYHLIQKPLIEDRCMVIYAATHTRGLWRSYALTETGCNVSVGMERMKKNENSFTVFPNPASHQATVSFTIYKSGHVVMQIFSLTGSLLLTEANNYVSGSHQRTLDISSLSPGIYFIQIGTNEGTVSQKLIIAATAE